MPDYSLVLLVIIIFLALAYAFANGLNDAANAIATVISTRALSPLNALFMGATMNLLGALTGTAVAKTIGKGIIHPEVVTQFTVMAALIASAGWVFFATRYGLPVSVTHSLIAGLAGAGVGTAGFAALVGKGLTKVLIALALSPLLGFSVGLLLMVALYWLNRGSAPAAIRQLFGKLQILSAAFVAYSHGKNDGQNAMGVITMALVAYFGWTTFEVPLWVILLSGLAIAVGTAYGGWKVIRTLGMRITKLESIHGFAAETSAASVIEAASLFGLPVSTTHTISSAIMGVGATKRLSAVRWGVTGNIVFAWVVTYPICFLVGLVLAWALKALF